MGRPASDLDDYLEWQQRLENQKASGLSIDDYCLQEGISKSTYYRWADRLREGIPEAVAGEHVDREKIESGNVAFVPITLKASPVEIELRASERSAASFSPANRARPRRRFWRPLFQPAPRDGLRSTLRAIRPRLHRTGRAAQR